MEPTGEIKKIRLTGEYKSGVGEAGLGDCVKEALQEAGYDIENMLKWARIEDMEQICGEIGLKWHGKTGNITIDKNQPVIAIFETRQNKAHAEFVNDLGPLLMLNQLLRRRFLGIIEFPKKED